MRSVLVLLSLVACVSALRFSDVIKEEWNTFKLEHGKNYQDETEESFRFMIFNENRYKIAKHNALYAAGKVSYKMGINKYSDMLNDEFQQTMNGFNYPQYKAQRADGVTFISPAHVTVPTTVDWRTSGAVTGVKNQGICGSCWAFSATGALEGQHFLKTGVLVSLSEQNLIDCSDHYGNKGCGGGWMNIAFIYIKNNGGIDTEKSYPYKAINDSCHFDKANVGATDRGFVNVSPGREDELLQAVATVGPISVAIHVSADFKYYKEGVYNEPKCNKRVLNHAVLVVGYGTDAKGQDYWLVKNSWGSDWGDKGYIKMARNADNQCGIASAASYPLV